MHKKLIIAADRAKARIYRERPFFLMNVLENELGREKNRAMTTDKPGASRNNFAGSSATHSMTGEKDPHDDVANQFARIICHYLEHAENGYDRILIAAEPRMLGKIRGSLSEHLKGKSDWLGKDFGHFSDYEVAMNLNLKWPKARGANF